MNWELIAFFSTPFIRSLEGWARNSLADGQINSFEMKELAITILRVGIIQVALFLVMKGWYSGSEENINLIATGAAAFLMDKILNAFKKPHPTS